MVLKLYGYMLSQPTRAVAWLLRVKELPFEFVPTVPRTKDTASPEYLRMNPNGQIPVIQDDDFTLYESNAILQYLAEKNQWNDVYPSDVRVRAKILQYLHWHHTNMRHVTVQVVRPIVFKARGVATPEQLEQLARKDETLTRILTLFETFLADAPFVAGTQEPTIADYACYCELDQLEPLELVDFDKVPKVRAYIERMKKLPFHDDVRKDFYAICEKLRSAS